MEPVGLPALPGHAWRVLGEADEALLQGLCDRCADYFELCHGHPARATEAIALLSIMPAGKAPRDKLVLGLFRAGVLVGALDAVRDYPWPAEWYLSLLLLDPAVRGQGLGTAAVAAFTAWAAAEGAAAVRLGVLSNNDRALAFWQRQGFAITEVTGPAAAIVMRRTLRPSTGA